MGNGVGFYKSGNGFIPLFCFDGDLFFMIEPGLVVARPFLVNFARDGAIKRSMAAGDIFKSFSLISFRQDIFFVMWQEQWNSWLSIVWHRPD